MSTKGISTALRIRRTLRSSYTTVVSYFLLLTSVCILGSQTFWADYHYWQVPSLLRGFVGTAITSILGLGLVHIVSWSLRHPIRWRRYLHAFFRRGHATMLFVCLSAVLLLAIALVPRPESPVTTLYAQLEKTRQLLGSTRELQKEITRKPRYMNNDEVNFAELILDYRLKKQVGRSDYEQYANMFYQYRDSESPNIRGWAMTLAADALNRSGQRLKASGLYSQVASDLSFSNYLRRWAYQELGVSSYSYIGDRSAAAEYWKQALNLTESRGLYENLAIVYSDQGDWNTARTYFQSAEQYMKEYQKKHNAASLRQQWATLYVNWAETLRRQAMDLRSSNEHIVLIEEARDKLRRAQEQDEGYLDRYWTGVRLSLSVGDFSDALDLVEKANQILARPDKYDLNRLSYDKYGKAYTTWLEAVVLHERTPDHELLANSLAKLSEISEFENQPVTAIYRFLKNVESTGYTINEDIEVLLRMADTGVLLRKDQTPAKQIRLTQ